jgi:hypothetical protein
MPIQALKGDFAQLPPNHSQAVALWIFEGFNTRRYLWEEYLDAQLPLQLIYPQPEDMEDQDLIDMLKDMEITLAPWQLPFNTLWQIQQHEQLEYIYIFSNDGNRNALSSLEEIDELINNCLTVLSRKGINSVSFPYIPADMPYLDRMDAEYQSAEQMIQSTQNWLSLNNDCMTVYFIDSTNGFLYLLWRMS